MCRFGQSSRKIEAVIVTGVTSLDMPVSRKNELKTQMDMNKPLG